MGLAASQGRLLLLTARKSDLEFQAQQISQERLLLSMKQEKIASDYNDALNNQIYQVRPAGKDSQKVAMSVASLRAFYNGQTEVNGRMQTNATDRFRIKDTRTGQIVDLNKLQKRDGNSDTPDSELQQMLLHGFWLIETQVFDQDNGNFTDNWETISIAGESQFSQDYYTQDDAEAKARYDLAMQRVQRLDKQLEIKLNQVETQHKAVETEIESVDKIIQNNIEGSFKYFS